MSTAESDGWSIERRSDSAEVLHRPWPEPGRHADRVVALCSVVGRPAVVLGSTQPVHAVDRARAEHNGVDVVRRSSGGGAVMVGPAAQVWLEAWIPHHDPLWVDDVIESSWWLGQAWAHALEGLGASELAVHRGRAVRSAWSDVVCFAGVGPGEVMAGPSKVVGIAQRRTRDGARLHSMAMVRWEPQPLLAILALDADRHRLVADNDEVLDPVATDLRSILPGPQRGTDADGVIAAVEAALLSALP